MRCHLFQIVVFFCLSLYLGVGQASAEQLSIIIKAESAILMNADTGVVLYEKNAHQELYPASITKVATALYALKVHGDHLEDRVVAEQDAIVSITEEARRRSEYAVPAHWLEPKASHIGIKKGEALSLRNLIYGALVASGNDACNVIAQHLGGTVSNFMEDLNAYLKEIGCQKTNFCNPHGLHHPKHKTTAYEMAIVTREALKDPLFREIVKTVRYTRPKTNMQSATTLVQTNRLLRSGKHYYQKAIGVKTGYTSEAQNTFIAAATHEGRTIIAVLMKAKERDDIFKDAKKLFDAAFSQTKVQRVLLRAGLQKYQMMLAGAGKPINTYIKNDICVDYYPAEEPDLRCKLYWDKVMPPIVKDQHVGDLQLSTPDGRVVQTVPLLAMEDVESTWSHRFKNIFSKKDEVNITVQPLEDESLKPPVRSNRYLKGAVILIAVFFLGWLLLKMRRRPGTL